MCNECRKMSVSSRWIYLHHHGQHLIRCSRRFSRWRNWRCRWRFFWCRTNPHRRPSACWWCCSCFLPAGPDCPSPLPWCGWPHRLSRTQPHDLGRNQWPHKLRSSFHWIWGFHTPWVTAGGASLLVGWLECLVLWVERIKTPWVSHRKKKKSNPEEKRWTIVLENELLGTLKGLNRNHKFMFHLYLFYRCSTSIIHPQQVRVVFLADYRGSNSHSGFAISNWESFVFCFLIS